MVKPDEQRIDKQREDGYLEEYCVRTHAQQRQSIFGLPLSHLRVVRLVMRVPRIRFKVPIYTGRLSGTRIKVAVSIPSRPEVQDVRKEV